MLLSREARVVAGVSLLTVPTVMYGGVTLLGILTSGAAGLAPGNLQLNTGQWALFRAGHAHAGVWLVLALVLQILLDSATGLDHRQSDPHAPVPVLVAFTAGDREVEQSAYRGAVQERD